MPTPSQFRGAVDLSQMGRGGSAPGASFGAGALPSADDVTKTVDLLDSEVNEIARVHERLADKARGRPLNYDDFQREIKERFAEIGFVVDVVWYHTNVDGVKMPEIVIKARTERREFDRDQMKAEVLGDTLGLGAEHSDPIKVDADMMRRIESGDFGGGHQH